jgi:hypothetical protein
VLPAATPVTTPLASIVATPVFDDVQTPFAVAFASAVVEPAHTSVVPLIAATCGIAFTVTTVDTDDVHPFALVTVYVIVVVPAATPVTTPVEALIVAVAVLAVDHTPPVVVLESVVVAPSHTDVVPVIAATTGKLLIVTVVVTALVHPFEFVYVYVIVAVPAVTPVTFPVIELTVATAAFDVVHTPPDVVLVKIVLDPIHAFIVPPIAARTGNAFTLTVACAFAVHPFVVTV